MSTTDWFGRPCRPGDLGMQGLGFTVARGAVPLDHSFRDYLAAPIRPVGSDRELLGFLRTCRYVSDTTDEWIAPHEFERRRA